VRGSGAFVKHRDPSQHDGNGVWQEQLDQLIQDAKSRSLNREQVLEKMRASLDRVFWQGKLRLIFVECNLEDLEGMKSELASAIGQPFEGMLLSDFSKGPPEIAQRFDLIVTTFFHLGQVTESLASQTDKIVGVNVIPNHEALLDLARLRMPVIGLVCAMPSVAETLTHIIQTYHPSATVIPALIDDEPRLRTLFEKADAIVVTRGFTQQLLALKPKAPVIPVVFSIEQQSIDYLESRIQELVRTHENIASTAPKP
jgi:GntR family transcriptional regulator